MLQFRQQSLELCVVVQRLGAFRGLVRVIDNFEFNQYDYRHIQVNGAVAKKKFNGELIASDPNLDAHLNGLIDFSAEQPKFDFEAEVAKADLTKLHFVKSQVEFDGKFKCNFTGDNIDNFLGKASIYDASLFKNGGRVSFGFHVRLAGCP